MGLFSALGGIVGGIKAKGYSKKAAAAQVKAAEKGIGEVRNQWGQTQQYYQPWVQAGTQALGEYSGLVGMGGPEQQAAAIAQLQASPYYQSLYRTGEEALLQNASATGGLRGGNTQRGLADFGADTLSQAIQQQLTNLQPGLQYGAQATGNLANAGVAQSENVANLYLGQGQAKAADQMRRMGLSQQIWNNVGALGDQAASFAMGGFGAPGGGFNMGAAMASPGGQSLFGGK